MMWHFKGHLTFFCFFVDKMSPRSGGQVLHRLCGARRGGALLLWSGGDAGGGGWGIQGNTCTILNNAPADLLTKA